MSKTDLTKIRTTLSGLGLKESEYMRFIESLARLLSGRPDIAEDILTRKIKEMGWPTVELTPATIGVIKNFFCDADSFFKIENDEVTDPQGLNRLLKKVYNGKGYDFRYYAKPSLNRRFTRRLLARGVESYDQYIEILDKDDDEYQRLFDEAVVRVTRFFRNEEAFEALAKSLATLVKTSKEKSIKVWSAGCATGQEPVTIAMQLKNLLGGESGWDIEIVATDIDRQALQVAAKGFFSTQAVEDIPAEWLDRFFTKEKGGYQVSSELAEWLDFVPHNLVTESGLEDFDLIVCRNVIIYFEPALQVRVLEKFRSGLKPAGLLLLGRYEMLLKQARSRFTCIDFDARLYRKKR